MSFQAMPMGGGTREAIGTPGRYDTAMNSIETMSVRQVIQRLPEALINQIAAGEVVERPASVVKELLENALDAGATRLAIAIEQGGRGLIRISDNGCGLPPEEIPLAFAQHATSKIRTAEDLFAIQTMGFRGEALASIASVSHVSLTTRTAQNPPNPQDSQGVICEFRDGQLTAPRPTPAPIGTTLEVRDLFYSVPARRKFLRGDSAEFGHIHEMVLRTALAYPQVAISLTHNDKKVLDLAATSDHRLRVAECLGRELLNDLLPLHFKAKALEIHGFIGTPQIARATARHQYLFLNGRFIRDRSVLHALKEAYRGLIEPTAQPVGILFLAMDPEAFDINVHPQKIEVRFRDSNLIYSSTLAAVREKLLGSDLTPNLKTRPEAPVQTLDSLPNRAPAAPGTHRQALDEFFRPAPGTTQSHLRSLSSQTPEAVETSPRQDPEALPQELPQAFGRLPTPNDLTLVQQVAATLSQAPEPSPAPPPDRRFVQLHQSYLVVETPEGMMIIDQHALHERIMYEDLLARITRGPLEGQRLLIPEIFNVTPSQMATLEQLGELLLKMGIEITAFDHRSVAVQSFPSLFSRVAPREFLQAFLDQIQESGTRLSQEELLHELLDMASCKAAIKAGDPLSDEEIAALLARQEEVDRSSNCPHGRPTTLRLSLSDLEKQFKRK